MKSHHSFPDWVIEREWDDLFEANMALRMIASGQLSPERMIEAAKAATMVTTEISQEKET
jgi:hypothetical protein